MQRPLGAVETQMAAMHRELAGTTQATQCVQLRGSVSPDDVRHAARVLFDSFAILRCAIAESHGAFRFVQHDDFTRITIAERAAEAVEIDALLQDELADTLDPSRAVWRMAVVGVEGSARRFVLLTVHHAVVDASGFEQLFSDLFTAIEARHGGSSCSFVDAGIPPAIDDYLSPLPPAVPLASQSEPRLHYRSAALADRATRMHTVRLSEGQTAALHSFCRAERLPTNALLSAAMITACRHHGVTDAPVPFKTAVSLRDRQTDTRWPRQKLGCYISVASATVSPEGSDGRTRRDLVAVARDYHKELVSNMLRVCLRRVETQPQAISAMVRGMRDSDTFVQGVGITNVGAIGVPHQYSRFEVDDWHMSNRRVGGNTAIVLHAIEFRGRQRLSFVYTAPLMPAGVVHDVAGTVMAALEPYLAC